jgi:hypothetical protein
MRRATRGLPLVVALAACHADEVELPGDARWTSQHFTYHARAGDDVCPGIVDELERHFTVMQAGLGFSWPEDEAIDYYKYLDQSDLERAGACLPEAGGCAGDGQVHAWAPLEPHELVHAYLRPSGHPPPLLVVGSRRSSGVRRARPVVGRPGRRERGRLRFVCGDMHADRGWFGGGRR